MTGEPAVGGAIKGTDIPGEPGGGMPGEPDGERTTIWLTGKLEVTRGGGMPGEPGGERTRTGKLEGTVGRSSQVVATS